MSDLRQLNVRLDEEAWTVLDELQVKMKEAIGVNLSLSDVVRAGLMELNRRYPSVVTTHDPLITPPKKPRGRPKKN